MNNSFLDTNICVYAFDNAEPVKKEIAKTLFKENPFISSHVIIETYLVCSKKLKLAKEICDENTLFLCEITSVAPINSIVFSLALRLKERYHFSFLDAVIVASTLQAGCNVLYSEDMQHGQVIEDKLRITNPFLIS